MSVGPDMLAGRWERLQAVLESEGIGALIVYGVGVLGQYGMLQYLTGTFPDLKGTYAVFVSERPPVIVAGSPIERLRWQEYGDSYPEVVFPEDSSRHARLRLVADLVSTRRGSNPPAVAAGGGRGLPSADSQQLARLLTVPHLADASHLVSGAKRRKTEADLAGMRSAVGMAEDALDSFVAQARPGFTERAAAVAIEAELGLRGAATSLVHVSAGPYLSQAPTGRTIERGDLVKVFVEVANADGYWVELGAVAACGVIENEIRTLAENCIDVAQTAQALLRPGSRCSDVARALDGLVHRFGNPAFGYGHGVGIDEEPPSLSTDDDTVLESGMTMALHPSIMTDRGGLSVAVANTYLIEDHQTSSLSERPRTIYRIA